MKATSRIREIYPTVPFYGHGSILKRYAGIPEWVPLPFGVQHGWTTYPHNADFRNGARRVVVWSAHIRDMYRERYPSIEFFEIGAPFLYLLASTGIASGDALERRGSIVFPVHSSHLVDVAYSFAEFAEELRALPDIYHPVTVCMYYVDLERGRDQEFRKAGFNVVSAGKSRLSRDFLARFVALTSPRRFAFSNHLSSALFYANALGLPAFLIGPRPEFSFDRCVDPPKGGQGDPLALRQKYWDVYRFPGRDFLEQRAVASKELGEGNLVTAEMMRRLVLAAMVRPEYSLGILREFARDARKWFRK